MNSRRPLCRWCYHVRTVRWVDQISSPSLGPHCQVERYPGHRHACHSHTYQHVTVARSTQLDLLTSVLMDQQLADVGSRYSISWPPVPVARRSIDIDIDLPSRRRLRSSSTLQLLVPPYRLTTIGRRSFPVAASIVWNSLPVHLQSLFTFRQRLKTYLFEQSFPDIVIWHRCTALPWTSYI